MDRIKTCFQQKLEEESFLFNRCLDGICTSMDTAVSTILENEDCADRLHNLRKCLEGAMLHLDNIEEMHKTE